MSGIVGVLNLDGAPVDRRLLTDLTESLHFRGPDAQRMWIDGSVGFGHTLFATTDEAWTERQPYTFDNDVWIAADARVDAREDLVRELAGAGRDAKGANDAELLLHAYAAWGDDCVHHLLGDFVFAVWDRPRRRLFCVRDALGTKPFFYAHSGRTLVFSNTLDCLRRHPDVSDDLDDVAIADFLLFQGPRDFDTTVFSDIRRLPGGHALTWAEGHLAVRRYWSLRIGNDIRYKNDADYIEHFRTLFDAAVTDRLRTRHVGLLMSGGLDSSAIAAVAHRLLSQGGQPFALRASTIVYDDLIPDEERHYAGLVERALEIPVDYLPADDYAPLATRRPSDRCTPEPDEDLFPALTTDCYRRLASHARVALCGSEGDELLSEVPRRYFAALAVSRRYGRLLAAMVAYVRHFRALPPIGVRTALERWSNRTKRTPDFPDWLNEELVARLDLRERWQRVMAPSPAGDTPRPRAIRTMTSASWQTVFERFDAGVTGVALDVRHPFDDRRLIDYLLAIPVVPWCLEKTLLRRAMRGLLPEPVRCRPKTALGGHPVVEWLKRPGEAERLRSMASPAALKRYINCTVFPALTGQSSADHVYLDLYARLRLITLSDWLHRAFHPQRQGVDYAAR